MKKTVCIIIVFCLVILSCNGCNNSDITEPSITPAPSMELSEIIEVINVYNFFIDETTEIPSFNKLIKDRYGFEVEFKSIGRTTDTEIISNLNGLLYKGHDALYDSLRDKTEKYYTLNEFLENNEVFNLLPEQYRKSLEDKNGDIWCLPTQNLLYLNRRIYNEAIMDKHNLSVPSKADELVELLQTVRDIYTDDGELELLKITPKKCLWELKDILEYYGLTINENPNNGIICWNEETQRFEDTICNLDTDSLFDTIDYMRLNSLYEIDDIGSDSSVFNSGVFTEIRTITQNYKYMSGPFYRHKEHIFNVNYSSIFLPLGTTNPKATINLFVNTFFGSNEGNIYGSYGESGMRVMYDDSFSQVNYLTDDKIVSNEYGSPYIIGLVGPGLYNDYSRFWDKLDLETNERRNVASAEYKKMVLVKLNIDEIEVLAQYKNLYVNGKKPDKSNWASDNDIFKNMFYKYLKDGIDRDTFIDEYIVNMKKSGLEEFINDKNEIVNADSMFYYD